MFVRFWRIELAVFVMVLVSAHRARAWEGPGDTRTLPCRPTIACTADLVTPGALELEAGALYRRLGADGRQWTLPFLAKLTLAEWFQLQFGSNGYTVSRGDVRSNFQDDLEIGGKVHFLDQGALAPSLSASALASIPIFRATGYARTYDALFTLYASKDLGPWHGDLNIGENVWRVEGSPRPQEYAAFAVSRELVPPFGVMAEVYGFSGALPIATRDGGFLFAISHSPKPWLMFDFGGDLGFFPAVRKYSAFFGVSLVPALLWTPKRAEPEPPESER